MNITFAIADQIAQNAGEAAQRMGESLNQVAQEYIEHLATKDQRDQEWAQFEQSCLTSSGKRNGWKFNRDEAN